MNENEEDIRVWDNLDKIDTFVRKTLIKCYLKLDDKEEEIRSTASVTPPIKKQAFTDF